MDLWFFLTKKFNILKNKKKKSLYKKKIVCKTGSKNHKSISFRAYTINPQKSSLLLKSFLLTSDFIYSPTLTSKKLLFGLKLINSIKSNGLVTL